MNAKPKMTVREKRTEIRRLILEGLSYDAIAAKVRCSKAAIVEQRKLMVSDDSDSRPDRAAASSAGKRTKSADCTDVPAEGLENTRKRVELLALSRFERELENDNCDIRVAKDALSVVGARPKDAPEQLTVIFNQINNFAVQARAHLLERLKAPADVIDVTPVGDDAVRQSADDMPRESEVADAAP